MPLSPAAIFGQYRIGRKLGSGGMGEVYQATHLVLGRDVALKSCSARTDCVDDELIRLMYRAGCRGIFFGVEMGSPRMQRLIHKNLDLEDAAARIRRTTSVGMGSTVSLITGFPEETEQDVKQTVQFR